MRIDEVMPRYDAVRREHLVVDGAPADLYDVARHVDFLDAVRRHDAMKMVIAVRSAAERLVQAIHPTTDPSATAEAASLRLDEMTEHGEWVRLGGEPGQELAFGTVGQFWAGKTVWEVIDAADFATFDRPGFARIACNLCSGPTATRARSSATRPAPRRPTRRRAGRSCATGRWSHRSSAS